jgi:phytoene/squalene synthetase
MKELYDDVSFGLSRVLTRAYSTSFSLGIHFLNRKFHDPIYAIYGFVRLADEIVDSFHDYDKKTLFKRFSDELELSLKEKISLNPILNSFQHVVHTYHIERGLIDAFMASMEMDLQKKDYDREDFNKYVLGSAEVVGLMCLRVFVSGDEQRYQQLKPYGMRLGAAYQKINFLRDLKADFKGMGRAYFPGIHPGQFTEKDKKQVEEEIAADFAAGLEGIRLLPKDAGYGVYLSYVYYHGLFRKIQKLSAAEVAARRVRIPNRKKYLLLFTSYIRYKLFSI